MGHTIRLVVVGGVLACTYSMMHTPDVVHINTMHSRYATDWPAKSAPYRAAVARPRSLGGNHTVDRREHEPCAGGMALV